jgi:hypothetical protein
MIVKILRKEKIGGLRVQPGIRDLPEALAADLIRLGAAEVVERRQLADNLLGGASGAHDDVLIRNAP